MEPTSPIAPQNTPPQPFNPDRPISAVLQQDKAGFVEAPRVESTIPEIIAKRPASIIKTLESDAALGVKEQNESKIRMAIAEERRHEKEEELQESAVPHSKKILFIIVIALCLCLGLASVIVVYYAIQLKNRPVPVAVTPTAIPSDTRAIIDVTQKNYAQTVATIQQELAQTHDSNTIRSITFQYQRPDDANKPAIYPITTAEFIKYFLPTMPDALARAYDGTYVLGSTGGAVAKPFLLLTTTNYPQAFSGMLNYENTLFADFQRIFNLSLPEDPTPPTFVDDIFQNKDIRVLVDGTNTPILVYAFLDNNTVLITTSLDTLKEIYTRFLTGQFK